MSVQSDNELERQIAEWRGYVRRRQALHDTDADELEDHLRNTIGELTEAGLRPDEAFLVAVKRMGRLDELSREFAREHSDRLWKQLVLTSGTSTTIAARSRRDLIIMMVCTALAVVAIKLPIAFGVAFEDHDGLFYLRNLGLFGLAPLAVYFAWQRRIRPAVAAAIAGFFVLGAVAVNAFPLQADSQSIVLTLIHLPIALWLVIGVAYTGGDWLSDRRRMDFVRFTGEWFVYFVLIALGGGVLTAFMVGTFNAIDVDVEVFASQWLLPCGAVGAVVVAAWLVEAKQGVIENIAPVLTRVFTPLFTIVLLAFLAALGLSSTGIDVQRDVLILFDLLLAVVLGLVLYAVSARDPLAPPALFDRLQFALIISALLIDVLVLLAITGRITEWGSTPNKIAALGENVILLANLAWSAFLMSGFLRHRRPFTQLETWQTRYLAVYAGWAWVVVLAFPPIFDYV